MNFIAREQLLLFDIFNSDIYISDVANDQSVDHVIESKSNFVNNIDAHILSVTFTLNSTWY